MVPTRRRCYPGAIRMRGNAWLLFKPFVFRSTGFPFERLTDLRLDETIGDLDRLDAVERDVVEEGNEFLGKGFAELLVAEEAREIRNKAAIARLYAIRTAVI